MSEGGWGETERGPTGSCLRNRLSFFLLSHFIKPFLFSIYSPIERTQGAHQLLCCPSRCKVATNFNPDKLMLKVDYKYIHIYISSEDKCGKGSSAGAAWLKRREGYDITLYPLSYWVLGEKVGERLRVVREREGGLDVGKQRFIQ